MAKSADDREDRDSLGPLIAQAARSRHVQVLATRAAKWIIGIAASGALTTGALKVVTWATTRDGIVEQNRRIADLEEAVGLPRTLPEKQAEVALRARVAALESAARDRIESQIASERLLYERWVSISAALAEPRATRRAATARAAVEEYRELLKGGMLPRPAAEKVLESTIPRTTYQ